MTGPLRVTALLVLASACRSPDTLPRRIEVEPCPLGSVRLLAFGTSDACTAQDPRGADGPDDAAAITPWTPADQLDELRVSLDVQPALAVVVQCADDAGVVGRWGCDDDADERVVVRLDPICSEACPLDGDPCAPDAVSWSGAGGAVCVPTCARCGTALVDDDGDGFPVEFDCDDQDPAVVPGSTRPCDGHCGEGVEVCEDGAWGPCAAPEAECAPGDSESRACAACGTERRTCAGDCTWGDWGCGAGECEADATEPCEAGCGERTCGSDCTWGVCSAPCHCPGVLASGGRESCVDEQYCVANPRACPDRQTWLCVADEEGCHWSRACVSDCP